MARDTRERLLEIGLDQFARRGLAATTITQIESRAGLRAGSGSFYRHFSSKEELLLAVVERELDRLQEIIERDGPVAGVADARTRLAIDFQRVLTAVTQLDTLFTILNQDRASLGPCLDRIHKVIGAGIEVDTALLTELMTAGAIPRRDTRVLSVVLTSALLGYQGSTNHLGVPPGGVSGEELIASLVDLVAT